MGHQASQHQQVIQRSHWFLRCSNTMIDIVEDALNSRQYYAESSIKLSPSQIQDYKPRVHLLSYKITIHLTTHGARATMEILTVWKEVKLLSSSGEIKWLIGTRNINHIFVIYFCGIQCVWHYSDTIATHIYMKYNLYSVLSYYIKNSLSYNIKSITYSKS